MSIPKSLLGLTLLAVGNCLGDMNADVAMTKKGFGEMAITGCMAGPIFNILIGLGASLMKGLIDTESIRFSLYALDGSVNPASVLPIGLLAGQLLSLIIIFFKFSRLHR